MKTHQSKQRNHALTLVEVLVVIAVLAMLVVVFLPMLASSNHHSNRIGCVNYLKQISLACRIWEGDNGDKYPMFVSITNGGAMEWVATGNVMAVFQCLSNELGSPKIVVCPNDPDHFAATNFSSDFTAKNISYFVGVDADEQNPQMLLAGDDNFESGGAPVKSGLWSLTTNTPVAWALGRHAFGKAHFWAPARDIHGCGNIAITDGSVQQLTTAGLQQYISFATNRLAIP